MSFVNKKRGVGGWAFLLAATILGCGEAPCRKLVCKEAVAVEFVDQSGWPVEVFSGSVTLEHVTYEFGCNTAYPLVEGPVECGVGGILLVGIATSEPVFFVTVISDANGYYSKMVEPRYRVEQDFNGPGCGNCALGEVKIVLEAPVSQE